MHIEGNIHLPASKSISNRVLLIQALCKKKFEIENISTANDTIVLKNALQKINANEQVIKINVEDAGTPFRFLLAYLSTLEYKSFLLVGTPQLLKRPLKPLLETLQQMGANISQTHYGILIKGEKLNRKKIKIDGSISSQFISALCLIAPSLEQGLTIEIQNEIVSKPYIDMTLQLMQEFGIETTFVDNKIHIPPQEYVAKNFNIENDWSSACFFYVIAMLLENAIISLQGLQNNSLQGDSCIVELGKSFGIETTFENNNCTISNCNSNNLQHSTLNLINTPDLAIPFIVACAIKYPAVKITGIHHLAHKESNRIEALQNELKKVNIILHYENEVLSFNNNFNAKDFTSVQFNSYNDHRIVMALNLFSIYGITLSFDNIECVKKSFPNYWDEIKNLKQTI